MQNDIDQEGVIKFNLDFTTTHFPSPDLLQPLQAWREILYTLRFIGAETTPTGIVGYGNVSRRMLPIDPRHPTSFMITGTQTGHKTHLSEQDYSIVIYCDSAHNHVVAQGPSRPSSESLAHDVLYRQCPDIEFIFHIHSQFIWSRALLLGLPMTAPHVYYGTPDMAQEIETLLQTSDLRQKRVLAMTGHTNGILSFGKTANDAGLALMTTLAQALAYEESQPTQN